MNWYGPRSPEHDCGCNCCTCEDCCLDGRPDSLDITFGAGWSEPTVDSGKMGVNDPYGDCCNDNISSQTFILTPWTSGSPHCFYTGLVNPPDCAYLYQEQYFCPIETDLCDTPLNFVDQNHMVLAAWFQCLSGGRCRIKVLLELCAACYLPTKYASISRWFWLTPTFTRGGENCLGLDKTAEFDTLDNLGWADSEGFCVRPTGAAGDLRVQDGG